MESVAPGSACSASQSYRILYEFEQSLSCSVEILGIKVQHTKRTQQSALLRNTSDCDVERSKRLNVMVVLIS